MSRSGLGFALAKRLAEQGFNICMIDSEDQTNMNKKIEELKSQAPGTYETKIIKAQFEKMTTIEEYQSLVDSQLKDMDIGMVVLNVHSPKI